MRRALCMRQLAALQPWLCTGPNRLLSNFFCPPCLPALFPPRSGKCADFYEFKATQRTR